MAILSTLWHILDALWINLQPILGPDKPPGTVRRTYVSGRVVLNSDLYVFGDALFREEAQSYWASANPASFGAKPAGLPIMFAYPWEKGLRRPPDNWAKESRRKYPYCEDYARDAVNANQVNQVWESCHYENIRA